MAEGRAKKGKPRTPVLDRLPDYERLGRWLRQKRKDCHVTQQTVADAIGKPRQYFTKVESGNQRIDVPELLDVVRALHLPMDMTLGELAAILEGRPSHTE